jgi:RimJ/RimL family protein N-acetyltransferase
MVIPPQMTTERLHMRLPCADDLDPLGDLYNDSLTLGHVGTEAVWGRENIRRRLEGWSADYQQRGYTVYTLVQRLDGTVVGVCGLSPEETDGSPEVTCIIGRRFWACGYGREAVTALLSHVRAAPEPDDLTVRIEADHPSLAYMERELGALGFVFEQEVPHTHSGKLMRHHRWSPIPDETPIPR